MGKRRVISFAVAFAALALVTGLVLGTRVAAQDTGTPAAAEGTEPAHPAHIHTGTCDAVGDVVYPLTDLAHPGAAGSPEAGMDHEMGTPDDTSATDEASAGEDMQVESESTTTVTTTFDDLLGAEHVINLHESEENIGTYIACGSITGEPSAEGVLEVTLDEQNASGVEGKATLTDNGDGTIDVHVQLWNVMGTPVASPTS